MQELNELDFRILELIPKDGRRVKTSYIRNVTGVPERYIRDSIERLREYVPIVASREEPQGLFIANSNYEREKGLRAFENQAWTMLGTAKKVRNTNINTWEYDVRDPRWREKVTGELQVQSGDKTFQITLELDEEDSINGWAALPDDLISLIGEVDNQFKR